MELANFELMRLKVCLIWCVSALLSFDALAQFEVFTAQQNMGTEINSPYYEINPVMNADGSALYFNRRYHPGNIGGVDDPADIWISELQEDGSWTVARNAGEPLNDETENLLIGFMDDGKALLTHHQNGFAFSYYLNGQWLKPSPFNVPFFSNRGPEKWGSVSQNGRYIVFAIESFGTYGVEDLYVTQLRPDGSWSSLKNLGNVINTRFQEVTPMLAPDNRTLFFASNGHDGIGSFDIFKSERLDDSWRKWSEPENLGALINTDGADMSFSFLPDSEYAFMTSTIDSEGYSDIKRVRISSKFKIDTTKLERSEPVAVRTLPNPEETATSELSLDDIMYYSGVILNRKDRSPIVGDVRFEGDGGLVIEAKSFVDGQFKVELPKDHIWEMTIVAENYLKVDSTFEVGESYDEQQINAFYLEPLTVGNKIQLSNVLFYRGSANLVEGSEKEIQLLAETMRQNPRMEIFLEGHTDNRGNFDLNLELSQQRVAVVQDQLIRMGVDASRIDGKGYGGTRPIASNDAERTRMLNRRVEFTVVKN